MRGERPREVDEAEAAPRDEGHRLGEQRGGAERALEVEEAAELAALRERERMALRDRVVGEEWEEAGREREPAAHHRQRRSCDPREDQRGGDGPERRVGPDRGREPEAEATRERRARQRAQDREEREQMRGQVARDRDAPVVDLDGDHEGRPHRRRSRRPGRAVHQPGRQSPEDDDQCQIEGRVQPVPGRFAAHEPGGCEQQRVAGGVARVETAIAKDVGLVVGVRRRLRREGGPASVATVAGSWKTVPCAKSSANIRKADWSLARYQVLYRTSPRAAASSARTHKRIATARAQAGYGAGGGAGAVSRASPSLFGGRVRPRRPRRR